MKKAPVCRSQIESKKGPWGDRGEVLLPLPRSWGHFRNDHGRRRTLGVFIVFQWEMVVSTNGGTPIAGWFTRKTPIKMDDLGVPQFMEAA